MQILFIVSSIFVTFCSTVMAETFDPNKYMIESPFEACKGVVIVDEEKIRNHEKEWADFTSKCNISGQKAYSASWNDLKSLNEVAQHTEYQVLLESVADAVYQNATKSAQFAEETANCFKSKTPDEKCTVRMKQVMDGIYEKIPELRRELSLSSPLGDFGNDGNPGLKNFQVGMPNPIGEREMSPVEKERLAQELKEERAKAKQAYIKTKRDDTAAALAGKETERRFAFTERSVLSEMREQHKVNYLNIVYGKAPIFAVLDKPQSWRADGVPIWNTEQMQKAFMTLADHAKEEARKAKDSKEKKVLEYNRAEGMARWTAETAQISKEHYDLLHYIGYKNQVEEMLKKDTSLCAAATTIARRLENKSLQNNGVGIVASIIPGFGWGARVVGKAGGAALRMGRALTGVETAALTGTSMGTGFLGDSFLVYRGEVGKVTSRSGVGGTAEGAALKTAEQLDEARTGLKWNALLFPVGMGGTAASVTSAVQFANSKAIIAVLKAGGVEAEKAATVVKLANAGNKNAQKIVSEGTSKGFKKMLGHDPSDSELDLLVALDKQGLKDARLKTAAEDLNSRILKLSHDARQDTLKEAREIILNIHGEKFKTAEQIKQLNRDIVAVSRYGKVEDPKKMAEIIMNWDSESRLGLVSVYDTAREISGQPKFLSITNVKERREAAFKQALQDKGVVNAQEVDHMCACSGVCASKAVSKVDFDLGPKLNSDKVCVQNSETVWLSSKS